MEWALKNVINNPYILDPNIDINLYNKALQFTKKLADVSIYSSQIILLGWIYKDIIDPRSFKYIKLDTIIDLIALAFTYLWQHDFKQLALLISAIPLEHEDTIVLNFTSNRSRITKELKDELDIIYPYKKVIVSSTGNRENNLAENAINLVSDIIYKKRWVYSADNDFIEVVTSNSSKTANIPADLKILLSKLVIHINKRK